MRLITIIIAAFLFHACNNSKRDLTKSEDSVVYTSKTVMTDTTKKDILEQIDISIRSGFYDKDALEIGKQVAATLEEMGFKLNWDKTVETRIEITNIKWQKRFGNDNCSYEKAIKLLSRQKN